MIMIENNEGLKDIEEKEYIFYARCTIVQTDKLIVRGFSLEDAKENFSNGNFEYYDMVNQTMIDDYMVEKIKDKDYRLLEIIEEKEEEK